MVMENFFPLQLLNRKSVCAPQRHHVYFVSRSGKSSRFNTLSSHTKTLTRIHTTALALDIQGRGWCLQLHIAVSVEKDCN